GRQRVVLPGDGAAAPRVVGQDPAHFDVVDPDLGLACTNGEPGQLVFPFEHGLVLYHRQGLAVDGPRDADHVVGGAAVVDGEPVEDAVGDDLPGHGGGRATERHARPATTVAVAAVAVAAAAAGTETDEPTGIDGRLA